MTHHTTVTTNDVPSSANMTAQSRAHALHGALDRLNALLSIKRLLYLF